MKEWIFKIAFFIGMLFFAVGCLDSICLGLGLGGILPKIPPANYGMFKSKDGVIFDQGLMAMVIGMGLIFPHLMREMEKLERFRQRLGKILHPFSLSPVPEAMIPKPPKEKWTVRLKKASRTVLWLLGFLYCQVVVAHTGYLLHYTLTDTSVKSYLYLPQRIGLSVFLFLIASLSAAGCVIALTRHGKKHPQSPKEAITEMLPKSNN